MNIALVGTGKTGKAVERLALDLGQTIVARFNSESPLLNQKELTIFDRCDVVIDFSKPALALPHIKYYCGLNLPVVMGTTGWYDHLTDVKQWVSASDGALLYAPNFSMGVAVLSRALDHATKMINQLPEYDASVHEAHHQYKLDSPSGTALHLANIMLRNIDRKKALATETQHQQIPANSLHVTSQRSGYIIGQHTVTFDGPFDQITLSHDAKNRDGFASGALRAAAWVIGKKGLFTLDDLLSDWLATGK